MEYDRTIVVDSSARVSARPVSPAPGLGDRVRALRLAAGLTQSDLAGERFSKEYVSQIERSRTRPTVETIGWLAARLGVEATVIALGPVADAPTRAGASVARAEALVESGRFEDARAETAANDFPAGGTLTFRKALVEGRALIGSGSARDALGRLQEARALAERPSFSDVERAEAALWLGVCRYELGSTRTAIALLDEANSLAERSGLAPARLRARIHTWKARCHRRSRTYDGAAEQAEVAWAWSRTATGRRAAAAAALDASRQAQTLGHTALAERFAVEARVLAGQLEDERALGQVRRELGEIEALRGNPAGAIAHLEAAAAIAAGIDSPRDQAQALAALARAELDRGRSAAAAQAATRALALFESDDDALLDGGRTRLVLGRALLEQGLHDAAGESFALADQAFAQAGSGAHRADAWVALGDLAAERGDHRAAARHYRNAAEALRDVRF